MSARWYKYYQYMFVLESNSNPRGTTKSMLVNIPIRDTFQLPRNAPCDIPTKDPSRESFGFPRIVQDRDPKKESITDLGFGYSSRDQSVLPRFIPIGYPNGIHINNPTKYTFQVPIIKTYSGLI